MIAASTPRNTRTTKHEHMAETVDKRTQESTTHRDIRTAYLGRARPSGGTPSVGDLGARVTRRAASCAGLDSNTQSAPRRWRRIRLAGRPRASAGGPLAVRLAGPRSSMVEALHL